MICQSTVWEDFLQLIRRKIKHQMFPVCGQPTKNAMTQIKNFSFDSKNYIIIFSFSITKSKQIVRTNPNKKVFLPTDMNLPNHCLPESQMGNIQYFMFGLTRVNVLCPYCNNK